MLTVTASLTELSTIPVRCTSTSQMPQHNRPVFQSAHYSVSVNEDRPPGSTVVVISATDDDVGENAPHHLLPGGQYSTVPHRSCKWSDHTSSRTRLRRPNDLHTRHHCLVTMESLRNLTPLMWRSMLMMVNDNAPQFLSPQISGWSH